MSRNGHRHPARPRIELSGASASPEEAAAITAAVEQFMRDTAPAPAPAGPANNPWQRAGILDATGRGPGGLTPWSTNAPWGA